MLAFVLSNLGILTPELLRLVPAGKLLQLPDQAVGLAVGEEFAGLHRVDQQLQLRDLKHPRGQKIPAGFALGAHNVHAALLQCLDIGIDALALGADPVGIEEGENVVHRRGMCLVGFLLKKCL